MGFWGQGSRGDPHARHLQIDKDGIPHWDGNPAYAEEWEERVWLRYHSCEREDQQRALAARVRNGLTGRAWTMTHKIPTISAVALTAAARVPHNADAALLILVPTVKAALMEVAPLQKNHAFNNFFKKGQRARHEPVADYISRRGNEYARLTELSAGTQLSEDVRAFFLLDMSGVSEQEHLRILGMAGNEYRLGPIGDAMMIQMATVHVQRDPGRFMRGKGSGGYNTYPVEDASWEMASQASSVPLGASAVTEADFHSATGADPSETGDPYMAVLDGEVYLQDYEEFASDVYAFEEMMEVIDPAGLDPEELETFAAEAQRLSRAGPYQQARKRLQDQRTDRGFGFKAQFSGDGAVYFDDKKFQERLGLELDLSRLQPGRALGWGQGVP